jgi:hypothetical protein
MTLGEYVNNLYIFNNMNALNAAKRRRAGITTNEPTKQSSSIPSNYTPSQKQNTGLTIHQVVALFDKRLLTLENTISTFMSASEEESLITTSEHPILEDIISSITRISKEIESIQEKQSITSVHMTDTTYHTMLGTIDKLTTEINTIKHIVLELQMYTMSVNKKLFENMSDSYDEHETFEKNVICTEEQTSETTPDTCRFLAEELNSGANVYLSSSPEGGTKSGRMPTFG